MRVDARELLALISGWFTAGFDTADFQEAKKFSTAALGSLRNLFMHHQGSQNQSEVIQPMMSPQAGSRSQRWTQIRCLCDAIAGEFHPEKIVLFGSYAYDTPRPDSDVDLLVIMPFEGSPFRQAAVILSHVVRTVGVLPMDLLVRTAEQVQERLHLGDSFMREILEHGKVLYSSTADAYEADHA